MSEAEKHKKKQESEMVLNNLEDRLECAIRHINTALDIDTWAQNLAVESMRMRIALMKGKQPTIEPERKKGKWERTYRNGFGTLIGRCGVCGRTQTVDNFCQNCGADLRGGEAE